MGGLEIGGWQTQDSPSLLLVELPTPSQELRLGNSVFLPGVHLPHDFCLFVCHQGVRGFIL